jgi:hypothetical protein
MKINIIALHFISDDAVTYRGVAPRGCKYYLNKPKV